MRLVALSLVVLVVGCGQGGGLGPDAGGGEPGFEVRADIMEFAADAADVGPLVDGELAHDAVREGAPESAPEQAPEPAVEPAPEPVPEAVAEPMPDAVQESTDGETPDSEATEVAPDVPWVCIPGARSCDGMVLRTCAEDGSGFAFEVSCDDGDACTVGDGCSGTKCLPVEPADCDDHNPCTADGCDPASGCTHVGAPMDGTPCEDDDLCTTGETCLAGVCQPGPGGGCDDSNPCTDDWCATLLGCVHDPNDDPCDDLDPCTTGDQCGLGVCRGVPRDCSDADPCTVDGCDPGTGECVHACAPCQSDAACDDGFPCTDDRCLAGVCVHEPAAFDGCCGAAGGCDDHDPCTADSCGPGFACLAVPVPGPGCCEQVPFEERFEDEAAGGSFVLDPPQSGVGWFVVETAHAASPDHALWYGDPSDGDYDNGGANGGVATGPEVLLPAGVALSLSFATWQDVEDQTGHDRFTVRAVSGDRTFDLWTRPAGFPMKALRTITVDLSPLAGMRVRLAFDFRTGDGSKNDGQGVYVDDVRVTSTCEPRPCELGFDCTAIGFHGWCQAGACDYGQGIRPEQWLGEPGAGPGQLSDPSGVASSADGSELYVTDRGNGRVQVFSPEGTFLRAFGSPGSLDGRFTEPRGIAVTADRVYVADTGNHRIQVFTTAGVFLMKFGGQGTEPGRMQDPKGVGVSPDGQVVFVADTSNHRVQAFARSGAALFSFGGYGKADGQFRSPSCIAVSTSGEVLVCDTQNARVQVFSAEGVFLRKLAPTGSGALYNPYGASVRWDGLLAVSDTYNHRVALFDPTGVLLDHAGGWGTGPSGLSYPLGAAWTPGGLLAVADAGNGRVTLFGFGPP